MFYQLEDEFVSIGADEISRDILTIGYMSSDELEKKYKDFGFSTQAFEESRKSEMLFSPVLKLYDDYILLKLDIKELDCRIALFVAKNLFLAVSFEKSKTNYRDIFMDIISRAKSSVANEERLISCFLEELMDGHKDLIELLQTELNKLEKTVFDECTDNNFNKKLLKIKNQLLIFRNLYEQIIELCERLCSNENDLFNEQELSCLKSAKSKAYRYRERIDLLRDSVNHIWDSYQAFLDIRLNQSMKTFTLLTTIFFPITIIVGWYGMNFRYMPELEWRYGYIYVIILTISVVAAFYLWFKKRKWL